MYIKYVYIKYVQLPHILKFSISSLSTSSVCHFKDTSQSLCFLNISVGMLTVQGWETERNGVTLYSGRQDDRGPWKERWRRAGEGRTLGLSRGSLGISKGYTGSIEINLHDLLQICYTLSYLQSFCTYICFVFSYSNKFY